MTLVYVFAALLNYISEKKSAENFSVFMKNQVYAYLRCYPNLIHADVSKLRESFTRREGIKSVV